MVSPADRSYLRGETELASAQSKRNARARIRRRVVDSILDFELLVEHLSDRDRGLIFEKRFGNMDGATAFDALVSAVSFLYRGVGETELSFETVLAEGINVAEASEGRAATVDLELTFRTLGVEQLRQKLEQRERLSLTEIAYLHASDEVRRDELARYFRTVGEGPTDVDDGRIQSKVTDF